MLVYQILESRMENSIKIRKIMKLRKTYCENTDTVRPQDTRPQTARTLTMHVFE
jgi:hypothetical protein